MKEDEHLLAKQQIKGTQKVRKHELARYYQQQPSSTFWSWIYQIGERSFDEAAIQQRIKEVEAGFEAKIVAAAGKKRKVERLQQRRDRKIRALKKLLQEGTLLMRWGTPPVIYSPSHSAATEQNFVRYLQSKGYFDAQVHSEVKLSPQKATVIYQVEENEPYFIGELRLNTADKALEELLQVHQPQSLLKQGAPYDQEVLRQERERIYELISNHGYFDFDRQYIRFDVDATDKLVVIETYIGLPSGRQAHPVYHIDHIEWEVNADQPEEEIQRESISYSDITFKHLDPQFNPRTLANKVLLHPPELYSKQRLVAAQRNLSRLGMFKYINIGYDTVGEGKLVPHIRTQLVDRYQLSNELGVQVSHGFPKPLYKLSFTGRNLFHKLETLTLATHLGLEGISATTDATGFRSSHALGVDLSLTWPQLWLPLKHKTQINLERLNPATKLSLGYEFTQLPDYTKNAFNSSIGYTWQGESHGTYKLTPLRLDLINVSNMSDKFQERLEELKQKGSNLHRTFNPSWVSSLSFEGTFYETPASDLDPTYPLLSLYWESGGALQNFIDLRKWMPQLEHYQYIKVSMGHSRHLPIRTGTVFAYHVNTGIAYPYGEGQILPYDRYYFLGGPNDMRAWAPRSLGPGAYCSSQQEKPEQPGELVLQGSIELRQQLIGFLEGALFVDAGNIWTLRDGARPGGKFSWQHFYEEIAIGTGVGLRLNFQLLVLRLDLGLKLYDPAYPVGERFIGHKIALNKNLGLPGQAAFNIGIGYPF